MSTDGVSADRFRSTCGRFVTGVAIVTAIGNDGLPHGITVNSFTSVSLDPPLILICLDCLTTFMKHFEDQAFAINVLKEGQEDLARRFARKEGDKFFGIQWHAGETGVPLLPAVLATMECKLTSRITEGDHFVLLGRVISAICYEGNPLAYFKGAYRKLLEKENGLGGRVEWV
jgi:flavin reductase (DIM6/NTAB) family NADH-FMN oxidoreductase RutF